MELFKKVHQTAAGLGRGVRGGMCDCDRMVHRLFCLRGGFGHHGWLCRLCRRQRRRLRRGFGYEIVRCDRTERDRTVVMQTVGSYVYEYRIQEQDKYVG